MVNIWKYEIADNIRLFSIDGRIIDGKVVDIIDAGEKEDESEDSICVENKNGIYEFCQSEVKEIQAI